jgi:hypothetical protein
MVGNTLLSLHSTNTMKIMIDGVSGIGKGIMMMIESAGRRESLNTERIGSGTGILIPSTDIQISILTHPAQLATPLPRGTAHMIMCTCMTFTMTVKPHRAHEAMDIADMGHPHHHPMNGDPKAYPHANHRIHVMTEVSCYPGQPVDRHSHFVYNRSISSWVPFFE